MNRYRVSGTAICQSLRGVGSVPPWPAATYLLNREPQVLHFLFGSLPLPPPPLSLSMLPLYPSSLFYLLSLFLSFLSLYFQFSLFIPSVSLFNFLSSFPLSRFRSLPQWHFPFFSLYHSPLTPLSSLFLSLPLDLFRLPFTPPLLPSSLSLNPLYPLSPFFPRALLPFIFNLFLSRLHFSAQTRLHTDENTSFCSVGFPLFFGQGDTKG